MPAMPEFAFDYWLKGPVNPTLLTCLMPNGVLIPLKASKDATLSDIKEDLWEEALKYPLPGKLHDMSVYIFSCINSMAETEELLDESRRLCDVKPFCAILKVIECKGDQTDKALNTQISHLIGKGLHEFDSLENTEVNDFRFKMRVLGDDIAQSRKTKTWFEKLWYQYPPRLASTSETPSTLKGEEKFVLVAKFENLETTFRFQVPYVITPQKVLLLILNKKATSLNTREHPNDFVLKVCGQDEYLIGDYPMIQFLYIQEALCRDMQPTIVVVSKDSVPITPDNDYETLDLKRPQRSSYSTLRKKGRSISSLTIKEKFKCIICNINRLNCDTSRSVEVAVQVGLFHGGKALCEPQKTTEYSVSKSECFIQETLTFDLEVLNVPEMSRLCFVVYEISKTNKGGKTRKIKESSNKEVFVNPLAWVNTTVYDFKGQLRTGPVTLNMWTDAEDIQSDDMLHPLGNVVNNPNTEHATALMIEFYNYSNEQIVYPSSDELCEIAKKNQILSDSYNKEIELSTKQNLLEFLQQIIDKDPFYEMHEQERKLIWSLRHYCLTHMPAVLPKLLFCVEWNDYNEVAEITFLIKKWPNLPAEKALELLDYAYADQTVRSYAVKCLSDISDEDLLLYLLQLVQAVKHESYLVCDLVEFLLRRALGNQKIGHYLFWHLRSEMQMAAVSVKFGLILEAYLRGSQEHIPILSKQIECLEKLKLCSEMIRQKKDKDKAKTALHESLNEKTWNSVRNVVNPLNPSYRFKQIRVEKCRVMDSKMRPLWIVFENADSHGDDIYVIFKNGDDLRQDMLTLQMIRIMDKIWKNEGLDLRMNPYGCISTEYRSGMIEVVLNAETIANIQKEKGMFSATSAFRKGSLLAWLKDHNTSEIALQNAIREFTFSCAGYCVATYVLGIADRHSDNIMVKKTGQLFHIDFGHILGHFKEKFGFKRERVPFVLTHDFVHVINKGKKEGLEFQIFQKNCESAFMILRKHGCLIISLCAMMISTGLPELSSEKDLNYLRDTLVLDLPENEAIAHFRSKFDEALSNSWKTSLNWASHNMAKNNKQ